MITPMFRPAEIKIEDEMRKELSDSYEIEYKEEVGSKNDV
jgi:hypothetical protein